MTDDAPFTLVRAISVRVSCMIHGIKGMTGRPKVFHLGHGNSYQSVAEARCTACPDDRWLRLEFEVDETESFEVSAEEYGTAMLAALAAEFDMPPEEEAHEETDSEPAGEATPPPAVGIPFRRRPL